MNLLKRHDVASFSANLMQILNRRLSGQFFVTLTIINMKFRIKEVAHIPIYFLI
jgi:hypothetical protein